VGVGGRFGRVVLIGLLAGLLIRLLALPPDLYARLFGAGDDGYVWRFSLAVAWVGMLLGGWLMWRRSGVREVPAGLLVGAVTGLAVSASIATLILVADSMAAFLVRQTIDPTATIPYPLSALFSWTLGGVALVAVLSLLGRWGRGVVTRLGQTLAAVARAARLRVVADYLTT
jgi:hypothetical protein